MIEKKISILQDFRVNTIRNQIVNLTKGESGTIPIFTFKSKLYLFKKFMTIFRNSECLFFCNFKIILYTNEVLENKEIKIREQQTLSLIL